MLEGIGGNPSLIFAVLRAAQNTNGSPLALYITGFGNYRALMQRAGIDLRDKVVLEIGAGPHPGTALAFLLHGAKKVVVNDIGKVAQVVSRDYARIIQLFAKVVTSRDTVPLDAVTEPAGGNEDNLTFSQDRFQAIPHTGAEAIGLPDESVDMIVSTSVLEHVMKPGTRPEENPHHFIVIRVDGNRLSLEVVGTGPTPYRPFNGQSKIDLDDPS